MFGQVLTFLGGFASIKILTSSLGPRGYGELALGLTIAGSLNMFVYGPIGQVVLRFFSVYQERKTLTIYFYLLKRIHLVSILVLLFVTAVSGALVYLKTGREWALLVIMASLFGIVSGVNGSLSSLQSAIRQRKIVALHQGIDAWLRPALAFVAIYLFRNSGYFALLGFLIGTLVITFSQYWYTLKNKNIRTHWAGDVQSQAIQKKSRREFMAYVSPFFFFSGFAAISMYADRWVLQGLFGENEVGIYTALYQIGNAPITFLFGLISQLVVPIIFERAGAMTKTVQAESSGKLLNQVVLLSIFLLVPIVMVSYYFGEPLVRILTNAAFSKYSEVLWMMVVGISLFNIGQLLVIKGLKFNRPEIYLFPKAVQAFSFLLLAYLLAKEFGLIGVVIALCGSSFLYLGMVTIVNRRLEIAAA
jgi:O-antigen/teichoic acid export membrane protein